MVGLSAAQLPPESLHAGDVIEYYSQAFVCGDSRGLRVAVVRRISSGPDDPYPVSIDSQEMLPLTNMVRRRIDRQGNAVHPRWRKLRTFTLVPGFYDVPAQASALREGLSAAVEAAINATAAIVRGKSEGIRSRLPRMNRKGRRFQRPTPVRTKRVSTSSTANSTSKTTEDAQITAVKPELHLVCAGLDQNALKSAAPEVVDLTFSESESEALFEADHAAPEVVDLAFSESESESEALFEASPTLNEDGVRVEEASAGGAHDVAGLDSRPDSAQDSAQYFLPDRDPTDKELLEVQAYIESVPTRHQRNKIRRKAKVKVGDYYQPRARGRRYQAKCAPTRSGTNIYHARSAKARKVKALLRLPGIKTRLRSLRERRPIYVSPRCETDDSPAEVPWPDNVEKIYESRNGGGITFRDVGDYGMCTCKGDCFLDTCYNALLSVYCTPDTCGLSAICSNAPRSLETLKLCDLGRVGIGVFTTVSLDVGDIVGEYAGVLCEYDGIRQSQIDPVLKHNTGYTMVLNTKSTKGYYVYVESRDCGFTTRFLSHSCNPNAAFVEVHNRANVKVLVRMIQDVKAGAIITVNYGKDTWFKCACDQCWSGQDEKL